MSEQDISLLIVGRNLGSNKTIQDILNYASDKSYDEKKILINLINHLKEIK